MTLEEAQALFKAGLSTAMPMAQVSACQALLKHGAPEVVPALSGLMARSQYYYPGFGLGTMVEKTCELFPGSALDLCFAAIAAGRHEPVMAGLDALVKIGVGTGGDRLRELLKSEIFPSPITVMEGAGAIRPLMQIVLERHGAALLPYCEEELWDTLETPTPEQKVANVHASARVLATLGDKVLPRGERLCTHENATVRGAVVELLRAMRTPQSMVILERRLHEEAEDDVRDRIIDAIVEQKGSLKLTAEQMEARIEDANARHPTAPVPWLDATKLSVQRRDGQPFTKKEIHYLLYRQSRVTEPRPDHEAAPLLAQVDRSQSTEAALTALRGFVKSKQKVVDRWTITWAGLTADDRLVPEILPVLDRFVELHRNHHATCATMALALLGTDRALLALDAISFRYRSKKPQVALTASEAFAEAAAARGITPEELGDLVVPWLGFPQDGPRILPGAKQDYEARISMDLKLSFRDMKSGKTSASPPSSLTAESKAAVKELNATLKDVVRIQTDRLEALMVKQVRWPVAHWLALYPVHPLLRPLASRLVCGLYDAEGRVSQTFRMLEDGAFTDVHDEPVTLAGNGHIGLVHPLEVDQTVRDAWTQHLADYKVAPLFPQMNRTIIALDPREGKTLTGTQAEGITMNALTFQGRAMRLGWRRLEVGDGGMIDYYQKNLPSAGLDCLLEVNGLFIRPDREQTVTLGRFLFVKHRSLTSSYDCLSHKDPRLVPFGKVPPIVYSEIRGDLGRMAGAATPAG